MSDCVKKNTIRQGHCIHRKNTYLCEMCIRDRCRNWERKHWTKPCTSSIICNQYTVCLWLRSSRTWTCRSRSWNSRSWCTSCTVLKICLLYTSISTRSRKLFNKLLCLGFGVCFLFQVFLSIGGVTKFIPSTGVTIPLVSYGGTSVISTLIIFNIIQGYVSYTHLRDWQWS